MRGIPRLILLLALFPLAPLSVHGTGISSSRSPAREVSLSVALPGRHGFQKNALAEVDLTLTNLSGHDIELATASCRLPYMFAEVVGASGKVLFPRASDEPQSACVPPPVSPAIHPGQSVSAGGFLILRSAKVRPVAQVLMGGLPVLVRGAPVTVHMYIRPAVRATIHSSPVPYAHLTMPKNGLSGIAYRYWYTCETASGARLTEEHPQSILDWDYGQGNDIHPRFNSDCTRVLDWHAIGGFEFSPVAHINDATAVGLVSPPVPKQPSKAATANSRYHAAFQVLDAVSHFSIQETQTRLAFPEKGLPAGLVNESETMEYVAPDRLLDTSRALNPVGKPATLHYIQVGPVICTREPYSFPRHTWQAYPYDSFTYRDHRPNVGLTVMNGLDLRYSFPKGSGVSDGPPQPATTVRFSSNTGTISSGGSTVPVRFIHIHVRAVGGDVSFFRVKYHGRLYSPSHSDETAKLTINAATRLPMLFQSTAKYSIAKGIRVLDERRQISFNYQIVPTIEIPASM